MYFIIYKTTNLVNGKFYIGKHQTNNLEDGYLGSGKILKRAIEKYGKENFTKEILFIFETENEMNLKEAELVNVDDKNSYNLCEGGKGGFGYINRIRTVEQQIDLSSRGGKSGGIVVRDKQLGMFDPKYQDVKKSWYQKGNKNTFQGKSHNDTTRNTIRRKVRTFIKENGHPTKNRKWMHKDTERRMIKSTEIEQYKKLGWNEGFLRL